MARPVLIEFPADDLERARRFWQTLLATTLTRRAAAQGRGLEAEVAGVALGVHERGRGPGDRVPLPYFPVADLAAALERVVDLGGEVVHPGERFAVCRDSEGTPFGLLAGPAAAAAAGSGDA